MIRLLAVMLVTMTILGNQADARGGAGGGAMGFGGHRGFAQPGVFARPGFFPHRGFVHNRFFFRHDRAFSRGFFVGPGVAVAPYPAYPFPYSGWQCYPPYPFCVPPS
jgi:hypothetical protein